MSLRKILFAVIAAAIIPCSLTTDAAKTSKKTHKTSVQKKSSKKSHSKKTATLKHAAAKAQEAKAETIETKATEAKTLANADEVSGETIVKTAMKYIGVPYRHGTSSPKSFDCSGFTSYVFKQYDITLSRCSRTQYTQGSVIKDKSKLRAGDLVFFQGRAGRGGVGHVGIVTDVNPKEKTFSFIHASCSKGVTTEQSTTAYYSKRFVGARRVLSDDVEAAKKD